MTEPRASQDPLCDSRDAVTALDGRHVRVAGVYRATALSKKPRPGLDPIHAYVELKDGGSVLLEPSWSPASARPRAERESFDGRRVLVQGTIHAHSPAPKEELAYITGPCVSPVDAIGLQEEIDS
jgi:hypothetical protein